MKKVLGIISIALIITSCEDNKRNNNYYQPRNYNSAPSYNSLPKNIHYDNIFNNRSNPERDRVIKQTLDLLYGTPSDNYNQIPIKTRKATPDDAYNEGYEEGYAQGRLDGSNGESHGYGYDDSNSYYDYYDTMYCQGYEEGYNDGYYSGYSDYEEEQEELEKEEEEW